ncbi:MAG: 16S rRNA (cytidine(1402)-2'-O)-methyltransferase, partial [Gemmatimonadetes bacterium]|nr:16S rRNA (cytidine(1402)-2'-O)-methyltransferase [Gemmatimonadota bacterium]
MSGGVLYLVGTPIGNLEDLSERAKRILREVNRVAAEDTRRTAKLLQHIGSEAPLLSFHAHNERSRIPKLIESLRNGEDIAVVSDAGNPGIADPCERLVRDSIDAGITIVPIPGPSAFLTAIAASGLSAGRFRFEGFLPTQKGARRARLEALRYEPATVLFYEAPHRLAQMLEELENEWGDRAIVLARELTKMYEEFWRGSVKAARIEIEERPPRGEYVVLV